MIKALDDVKLLVQEELPKDLADIVIEFLKAQLIEYSKMSRNGYIYGYYCVPGSPTLKTKRLGRLLPQDKIYDGIYTVEGEYLYFMDRKGCTSRIDLSLLSENESLESIFKQGCTKLPKAPIAYKHHENFGLRFVLKTMWIKERLHLVLLGSIVYKLDISQPHCKGWYRDPRNGISPYNKLLSHVNNSERERLESNRLCENEKEDWGVVTSHPFQGLTTWFIVNNTVCGFSEYDGSYTNITFPPDSYPTVLMRNYISPDQFAVELLNFRFEELDSLIWQVYQCEGKQVKLVHTLDFGRINDD